jgi:hypothetical protein
MPFGVGADLFFACRRGCLPVYCNSLIYSMFVKHAVLHHENGRFGVQNGMSWHAKRHLLQTDKAGTVGAWPPQGNTVLTFRTRHHCCFMFHFQ